MKTWRSLILGGVLTVSASAAVLVEGNFKFPQVTLKDGRQFTDITVRRYDLVTERVTFFAGKTIVVTPTSQLPDEIMAPLRALAPELTAEELAAERKKLSDEKTVAAEFARIDARTRELDARDAANAAQRESRKLVQQQAEQADARASNTATSLTAFAETYVRRYFGYNAQPGADASISLNVETDLSDPEPVPGWTGRWRFTGTAYTQRYHSQGGVSTRTRDFELLVQTAPGKKPEVVEMRTK